jgi:hypothetical protein
MAVDYDFTKILLMPKEVFPNPQQVLLGLLR